MGVSMSGSAPSVLVLLVSATLATGTAGRAQDLAQDADVAASPSAPLISIAPSSPPSLFGSSSDPWTHLLELQGGPTVFLAACCKTCRKGKACGDSCISQSKTCGKGAGCACDG